MLYLYSVLISGDGDWPKAASQTPSEDYKISSVRQINITHRLIKVLRLGKAFLVDNMTSFPASYYCEVLHDQPVDGSNVLVILIVDLFDVLYAKEWFYFFPNVAPVTNERPLKFYSMLRGGVYGTLLQMFTVQGSEMGIKFPETKF